MTTITLTATFLDVASQPQNGTVTFAPYTAGPTKVGIVLAEPVTTSVINGAMSIDLLTTDSYNYVSGQVSYRVVQKVGGGRQVYYIVLPSTLGTTADLADLTPYGVPPDVVIGSGGGTSSDPEVAILQGQVVDLQAQIDALQTSLDSVAGSVTGFTASVDAINTELGSNPSGAASTVASRLDSLESTQIADSTTLGDAITALDTRMTTAESNIGNNRLFSGTSYPPAGYTARNGDVWVDTTGL